jgi:chromate transporter
MVVAFVGFLGGWTKQVLGPDRLFLGAALAATVVTWFTFLPSFIFILAGGPLVAITAAVVGVIATIAFVFIAHIALPTAGKGQYSSNFDWIACFWPLRPPWSCCASGAA